MNRADGNSNNPLHYSFNDLKSYKHIQVEHKINGQQKWLLIPVFPCYYSLKNKFCCSDNYNSLETFPIQCIKDGYTLTSNHSNQIFIVVYTIWLDDNVMLFGGTAKLNIQRISLKIIQQKKL